MVASVTGFAERLAAIAICSKCKADLSAPFAEHCTTNYIILDRKTSVIFCDFVQQSRLTELKKSCISSESFPALEGKCIEMLNTVSSEFLMQSHLYDFHAETLIHQTKKLKDQVQLI
jgi:hypothetical protein